MTFLILLAAHKQQAYFGYLPNKQRYKDDVYEI